MSYICNSCGKEYKRIGQHWAIGSCNPPNLSNKQKEIIDGLLMGDGTIGYSAKGTPRIEANMTTIKYLEYLDSKFPLLGRGVHTVNTAEQNAQRDRDSGFNESASSDNYSDTYRWKTITCSTFDMYTNWYDSGQKVWPELEMTPTRLKHLFCCDGYYHNSGSHENITISMNNESDNTDKVDSMFQKADLPTPSWQIYEKNDRQDCSARFHKDESRQLWDYMGEPLPGFEYKWPTSSRHESR